MENKKQKGLTLVEVAIILVVVALAIGGVLKGQEMLTNAKLKRLQKDFSGISVALNTYQDRYLQLPGDDSEAFLRFSIYSDGDNDPLTLSDGYEIVNARLGFNFDNINSSLTFWGRNITDERFYYGSFDIPFSYDKTMSYPSEPATYGVTFRKNFD